MKPSDSHTSRPTGVGVLDNCGAHRSPDRLRSVELFAGAGGLALGCEQAGFESAAVLEWDRWACDTVRENRERGHSLVKNWRVFEGDIRAFDWNDIDDPVDLVAGGPPCQPFSMGGKHMAHDDRRDMFPAATHAIRSLTPRAFILENVRGLTRPTFKNYYEYILARLALPEYTARDGEPWYDHWMRLQEIQSSTHEVGINYRVIPTLVNAADYGVPQQRHRVFMVGFHADVNAEWHFPEQTHSREALMRDQWVTGEYWDRHETRPATSLRPSNNSLAAMTERPQASLAPWRTVRDAIADMPDPKQGGTPGWLNHAFQPGARSYPGHTGSHIDLPAKTLKAGGHGVPGGENMLRHNNGRIRYFSIRESARLQTFPDDYELHGAWGEAMRQLGNAVPVMLGKVVAASVKDALDSESDRTDLRRSMETAK
jgi:DNA (cytosine-5)-methyltransferase 1